jgi:hypothetical protein
MTADHFHSLDIVICVCCYNRLCIAVPSLVVSPSIHFSLTVDTEMYELYRAVVPKLMLLPPTVSGDPQVTFGVIFSTALFLCYLILHSGPNI